MSFIPSIKLNSNLISDFLINIYLQESFVNFRNAVQMPSLLNNLVRAKTLNGVGRKKSFGGLGFGTKINKSKPLPLPLPLPVIAIEETGVVEEIFDVAERKTLVRMLVPENDRMKLNFIVAKMNKQKAQKMENEEEVTVKEKEQRLEDSSNNSTTNEAKQESEQYNIEGSNKEILNKGLRSPESSQMIVVKTDLGIVIRTPDQNDTSKSFQILEENQSDEKNKESKAGLGVPSKKKKSKSQKKRENKVKRENRLVQKGEELQREYDTIEAELSETNKRMKLKKEGKSMGHLGNQFNSQVFLL